MTDFLKTNLILQFSRLIVSNFRFIMFTKLRHLRGKIEFYFWENKFSSEHYKESLLFQFYKITILMH